MLFSFGLLHRIPPVVDREAGALPSELEEDDDEEDLFVPADTPHASDFNAHNTPPHSGTYTQAGHPPPLSNGKIGRGRVISPPSNTSRSSTPVRSDSLLYSHVRTPTPTRAFAFNGDLSPAS